MPCFTKSIVRSALILALVGGTTVAIAGPERVAALVTQTKSKIHTRIDKHIADPIAIRAQLRDLEGQYPARIAEVRADLAELEAQQTQLSRELAVSERVVALADADLQQVQSLIARAQDARAQNVGHVIRVRLDNQSMDLDEAYLKANSISASRSAYASRAADIERDLGYLTQQRERLSALLTQLETERADFQSQLWALDRQVDAIARNDRMIELMSKRQETLDSASRYQAVSLDQLTSKMTDIRARQESELQSLAGRNNVASYERTAKYQLDIENSRLRLEAPFQAPVSAIEVRPPVIEIGPDTPASPALPPALPPKPAVDPDRIASKN